MSEFIANGGVFITIGVGWVVSMAGYAIISSKNKYKKWDPRFNLEEEVIKDRVLGNKISEKTKK